jgi:hypothetical protein
MKIRRSGSSEGWRRMNSRRCSATSARSPACAGAGSARRHGGSFFERDVLRLEKPPQTRQADADPVSRQRAADLLQGQVRLLGQQLQDCRPMLDQARAVVAAHRAGLRMTFRAPPLRPANRRAHADPKTTRRRPRRGSRTHRRRNAFAQIPRIWCRHIVPQRYVAPPLSPIYSRLKLFILSNLPDRKPL